MSMGEIMSPVILAVPFMQPKKLFVSLVAGVADTNFATGFPRLVIIMVSLLFCTVSISFKHLALNSPAAISLDLDIIYNHSQINWSYYIMANDFYKLKEEQKNKKVKRARAFVALRARCRS